MNYEIPPAPAPQAPSKQKLLKRVYGFFILKALLFAKKRWKLLIILTVILLPFLILFWWLFSPDEPEVILATAKRGDLVQTVEAVGTVISEKDLKLRFPITGVVGKVLVEEGDKVTKGQELANLRNDALHADVSAASANLASKNAALNELKEGTRPEDILIAEAGVENKRAALESAYAALTGAEDKLKKAESKLVVLLKEAETSLAGYVDSAHSESSEQLDAVQSAIRKLEDIFLDNPFRRAATFREDTKFRNLELEQRRVLMEIESLTISIGSNFKDYKQALEKLQQVRNAASNAASLANRTYSFVANLPLYQNWDTGDRENHKTTAATQSSSAQAALASIDSTIKSIRDASANFDTKIATEESTVAAALSTKETSTADIQSYEASLRGEEAELAKKKAGARQTEIDASKANVNQAYAELQRAKAKLEDTILRAPIDGTITKVNLKEGEFTGGLDLEEYSFSMLGASPYRIEMFVAEIDIPKVALSQTGSIDLDAFPNEEFEIYVSEIDPTATNRDGVSKYRVKLDFSEQDDRLKIGMTGDSEIYTDFREDVVYIPGRAVFMNEEGKDIVRFMDGNEVVEREIKIGMEGEGGDV
ncbi:efflux RND transporter periplasmic adaptor subunit, partial [Patescibacteria group bacterium]|nr:efflux RND transporter periplasmic adaptor subunit [Patescibacteria group bacterium]